MCQALTMDTEQLTRKLSVEGATQRTQAGRGLQRGWPPQPGGEGDEESAVGLRDSEKSMSAPGATNKRALQREGVEEKAGQQTRRD